MAKLTDFIPRADINAYIERSPEVLQGKLELAADVVEYAQSIAPVDQGDYKKGIKVRRRGKTGVSVEFTDWKSDLIEYGTADTPEFAVRARTAKHFGGESA